MNSNLYRLIRTQLSDAQSMDLVNLMHIPARFRIWEEGQVSRAELSQALNMLLFAGILERVPTGHAYTRELAARGEKVRLDHGALRTVRWVETGNLPSGEEAITRILKPLGYRLNDVYPLDRLKMTGRSYVHQDDPENLSQFFVSELHPERFSPSFQTAVSRVLQSSKDPLTPDALVALHTLEQSARLPLAQAQSLLGILVSCFACHHETISVRDYETLLAESAEMAWIATEGNVFNHATDRVSDVFAVSEAQTRLGRPMKENVEISASGRVKQTAFKADPVMRPMLDSSGQLIQRQVPGSFYEFITRETLNEMNAVTGKPSIDLSFDTGNAQGIFQMTAQV